MFVEDYTPVKRIGVEELEGCVGILERRIDEAALGEPNPQQWREEGAWLALHLMLTGRFRYPEDFVSVFDVKSAELFGEEG